jgi:hypothetical protein
MTDMEGSYQTLTFDSFLESYQHQIPQAALFELTLPWLIATRAFMFTENDQLIVHCLFSNDEKKQLLIAWPLVHMTESHATENKKISLRSLSSFYASVTDAIFFTTESTDSQLNTLLAHIDKKNTWHSMLIGVVDESGVIAQALPQYFKQCKMFNQTDNFYQDGITSFDAYYRQLPSQLRNTVKRRSKKLLAAHKYDISIVTTLADFPKAFEAYKFIYQQSWKGEEFSFAFIEQVCRAAIDKDKLRLGLLSINGEPAAAQLWFLQEGSASIFKLAYSPKYREFSVGSILSMAISEHVIEQDRTRMIEFGMGSEPYKKDWLAKKRQRVSYQVFNGETFAGKLSVLRYLYLPKCKQWLLSLFKS